MAEIDIYESATCSEKIGINCSCFSVEVGLEYLVLPVSCLGFSDHLLLWHCGVVVALLQQVMDDMLKSQAHLRPFLQCQFEALVAATAFLHLQGCK